MSIIAGGVARLLRGCFYCQQVDVHDIRFYEPRGTPLDADASQHLNCRRYLTYSRVQGHVNEIIYLATGTHNPESNGPWGSVYSCR